MLNLKRATTGHIVIKLSKFKMKRILKTAEEKQLVTYKGATITLHVDFSSETLQTRKEWENLCKILKEKKILSTKNAIHRKALLQK